MGRQVQQCCSANSGPTLPTNLEEGIVTEAFEALLGSSTLELTADGGGSGEALAVLETNDVTGVGGLSLW